MCFSRLEYRSRIEIRDSSSCNRYLAFLYALHAFQIVGSGPSFLTSRTLAEGGTSRPPPRLHVTGPSRHLVIDVPGRASPEARAKNKSTDPSARRVGTMPRPIAGSSLPDCSGFWRMRNRKGRVP
jgi:hypothetical protein